MKAPNKLEIEGNLYKMMQNMYQRGSTSIKSSSKHGGGLPSGVGKEVRHLSGGGGSGQHTGKSCAFGEGSMSILFSLQESFKSN